MKNDVNEFIRKLKFINHFQDCDYEDESICREKSHYNPLCNNHDLNRIIDHLEREISSKVTIPDNITSEERKALSDLKSNQDITI